MKTPLRIFLIAALSSLAVVMTVSCQSSKSSRRTMTDEEAYLSSLTAVDTAALIAKADSCITLMVAGQMDEALADVGYVDDVILKHLTPEMVARTAATFKSLGVCGFERSGFELSSAEDNIVRYRLKIGGPSADSGAAIAPTTGFAFNAYRIDGNWYLSLKQ